MSGALVRRLNSERTHHRKRPLAGSRALRLSAQARARYLAKTGKLEHGTWWKVLYRFAGKRYRHVGENIAEGQDDAAEVVAAWMDSPTHRANILGDYTHIGSGRAERNGRIYWCNHFGKVR